MIIAKEDTVATDLKAVQQYALEQGILDKNWGSDQRMSAAYYLDPHILHIVDLQGQIIQIMSYNIEYIALKKETIPPAELFTHVADVKSFKIYKVEREQLRSLFSQNNNVATGAVSLNNNMPHKKVYYSLQVAGFNNNHALYSGRTHEDGSFEMFVPQTQEGQKIIATFYSWGYKMKSVEIIPGQIHTVSLEEGSFFKHDVPISSF